MIGYIKESHSPEPKSHEWLKVGETGYRSVCNRWTVLRENVVLAVEMNCMWCLSRDRRRRESAKSSADPTTGQQEKP